MDFVWGMHSIFGGGFKHQRHQISIISACEYMHLYYNDIMLEMCRQSILYLWHVYL